MCMTRKRNDSQRSYLRNNGAKEIKCGSLDGDKHGEYNGADFVEISNIDKLRYIHTILRSRAIAL